MSRLMVCALLVAFVSAAHALGQDEQDVNDLRRLIQSLESKLADLEGSKNDDSRVTQIGGSVRARDPDKMIVRIYDLSDLFSVAPAYIAQRESDLSGGAGVPLFASAYARGVPANPLSLGGGLGGMGGFGGGMGGMGGFTGEGLGATPSSPGMGGGGFFSIPSEKPRTVGDTPGVLKQITQGGHADVRTTMDDLIEAITSTIAPTEWVDVGGCASMEQLGTALLISASENTHEQIDALLALFRKRWGSLRTISVQARWLWLKDQELTQLLPGDGKGKTDDIPAFGLVDETAWQQLLDQRQAGERDEGSPTDFRAVITCYNGQTVHTVAGGQTLMITSFIPVVGGELETGTSVGYRPVVNLIQEGAALQVTPVANTSGKYVVLDIHSRVNLFHRPDPAPDAAAPKKDWPEGQISQISEAVDRPRLVNQRLSTTLRVPVDRTMLVGGMTFESPAGDSSDLYLFVKVAIQELRDDVRQEKMAPEKEPAPKNSK